MLSTRPDVVGPELAAELSKLQSDTPPNPPEVVRACSTERPAFSQTQLQAELSDVLADSTQVAISEINLSDTLNRLTVIIRKYNVSLQPSLSALLKTLVLLEGTAERLDPKFSLAEVMKPYSEKILIERFSPGRIGRRLLHSYRDWDRLLTTLPRDVGEALGQFQTGKFKIQIDDKLFRCTKRSP